MVAIGLAAQVEAQVAVTRMVDPRALAGGDGITWATAYQTIDEALDWFANNLQNYPGSHILVAEDTYYPTTVDPNNPTDPRTRSFRIPANLTEIKIHGGYLGLDAPVGTVPSIDPSLPDGQFARTTLSGEPYMGSGACYHVINLEYVGQPQNVTFDGFSVFGGRADQQFVPAGRRGAGASLTGHGTYEFENMVFCYGYAEPDSSNNDGLGGAIWIEKTDGNSASPQSGPCVRLDRCVIHHNSAALGGGLYVRGRIPVWIGNCIFMDNGRLGSVSMPGLPGAPETLRGGAVAIDNEAHVYFSNSMFRNNSATDAGGAIHYAPYAGGSVNNYRVALRHCTLAQNTISRAAMAASAGVGIHVAPGNSGFNQGNFSQKLELYNTIFYEHAGTGSPLTVLNDPAQGVDGIAVNVGWSDIGPGTSYQGTIPTPVSADAPGITDIGTGSIINLAPDFVSAASGNLRLLATSPCVDQGNGLWSGVDIVDIDEDNMFFSQALPDDLDLVGARLLGQAWTWAPTSDEP